MDEPIVDEKSITLPKSLKNKAMMVAPMLEGRRVWLNNGAFKMENTGKNREKLASLGIIIAGGTSVKSGDRDIAAIAATRPKFRPVKRVWYPSLNRWKDIVLFDHQHKIHKKFLNLKIDGVRVAAIFGEMGTGKTLSAINLANHLWCAGVIDAVLLLAKKGVHEQWLIDSENAPGLFDPCPVKAFTQGDIPYDMHAWNGKEIPSKMLEKDNRIKWLSFNFDAPIHEKARKQMDLFVAAHKGGLGFIGDETHKLKTPKSTRTVVARNTAKNAQWRLIMTGSPIAKDLVDEYSQLGILSESIIGHKYVTAFKSEFCIMGGFENRSVVGAKNLDKFKELTEPYVFRVLKSDCFDLPPKQYMEIPFELSVEQKLAISEVKSTQSYVLPDGDQIFFEAAPVVQGKIQEISNGYLTYPGGTVKFPNPRLAAFHEFVEGLSEKIIIWVRYRMDVTILEEEFGDNCVSYHGGVSPRKRTQVLQRFKDPKGPQFIIATSAMAEGVDGLQNVCQMSIYYSNSFDSLARWQSEDRIHRLGMGGSAVIGDMVAKGCIDYALVRSLRMKKSFSEMVLDIARDVGMAVNGTIRDSRDMDIDDYGTDADSGDIVIKVDGVKTESDFNWGS